MTAHDASAIMLAVSLAGVIVSIVAIAAAAAAMPARKRRTYRYQVRAGRGR